MKTKILGTVVLATLGVAVVVGLRRMGPTLAEHGMKKCHEMMARHMSQACPPGHTEQTVPGEQGGREGSESPCLGTEQTRTMAGTT